MKYGSTVINLVLLASATTCVAGQTTAVKPFVSYRSQSQDLARQKVGTIDLEYKIDNKDHNFVVALTPEYTRSFNGDDIPQLLFGCYFLQSCNSLNIIGSAVPSTTATDLCADWFGLASDYQGSVCFEPLIQNFNADLEFYWGMDKWAKGMFLRVHAPLTWTKWDLGAKFTTTNAGTITPPPNGHTVTYLNNAEKFFCKKETESSTDYTPVALSCARFCGCLGDGNKTKTRLADIQADFGWNFFLEQDYNVGLFARIVAPTGNKVKGEWLFEPIVGNGHHWELGAGLTSSYIFWRNQEEDRQLGFYLDANVTHLFDAHQTRVFDLKDKPLSRYIEAAKVGNIYSPLANLTSCKIDVNVPVQADITALFNFTCKNWSCDLGYNFWIRSCEKFGCDTCTSCNNCSCCDSCENSTTCCGQCTIKSGNTENWSLANAANIHVADYAGDVVLTDDMIDYDGARTKGLSNKVFAHINYSWMDCKIVPFIGLGGFAEFGHNSPCCTSNTNTTEIILSRNCNDNCSTNCNDCSCCTYASLSQWGVWLKGGVSF